MHRLAPLRSVARRALRSPPRPRPLPSCGMVVRCSHSGGGAPRVTQIPFKREELNAHLSENWHIYAAVVGLLVFTESINALSRMRPRGLARETISVLSEHSHVAECLGAPVTGIEALETGELIQHSYLVDDDNQRGLRVKFKLRGSKATAVVHAEVIQGMSRGDFRYLLVEFPDGRALELVDNRQPLSEDFDASVHSRMKPFGLARETLGLLSEESDVTECLGSPLIHIEDFESGEMVEHSDLVNDHNQHVLRIKFKISGPEGEADVYAQVVEGMERGEFEYLRLGLADGETLELVNNRSHVLHW